MCAFRVVKIPRWHLTNRNTNHNHGQLPACLRYLGLLLLLARGSSSHDHWRPVQLDPLPRRLLPQEETRSIQLERLASQAIPTQPQAKTVGRATKILLGPSISTILAATVLPTVLSIFLLFATVN